MSRIIPVEEDGRVNLGQHPSIKGFECRSLNTGALILTPLVTAHSMGTKFSRSVLERAERMNRQPKLSPHLKEFPRMKKIEPGLWCLASSATKHKFVANLGLASYPGVVQRAKRLQAEEAPGRVVALYGPAPCIGVFTNDLHHRALNSRKRQVRGTNKTS